MRTSVVEPALLALLAANAALYAASGRPSEGLDALAWFALLVLFSFETRCPAWTGKPWSALALDLLRLIATAAIVWAAVSFVREREWLDAANAWLWISVVVLLELELRVVAWVAQHRRIVTTVTVTLYSALAIVALIWLLRGEWFDAYDAALWIAAFALLELDVQRHLKDQRSSAEEYI